MNDNENFLLRGDQEMADPDFPELIHSCGFCYVQELDPGMEPKGQQVTCLPEAPSGIGAQGYKTAR